MTRPIQQMKQDLETLQQNILESATELRQFYNDYLQVLSQSVKQQLILASYQLCTQIYPDSFLKLSFSQRQQLQQKLRSISQEVGDVLQNISNIEQPKPSAAETELNLLAEMIKNLPLTKLSNQKIATNQAQNQQSNENNLEEEEDEDEAESLPEIVIAGDQSNIQELAEHLENIATEELDLDKSQELDFSNPDHLVIWQKRIEKNLRQFLNDISSKTNKLLQEYHIIPNNLPSKVIDMAIQAHDVAGNSQKTNNSPNIINLVVETEKEPKGKKNKIAQISLLRLRLSEIEFIEATVSIERNKIRSFLKKVEMLRRQYKAKEREYAIAEAQAAWRAGWYED